MNETYLVELIVIYIISSFIVLALRNFIRNYDNKLGNKVSWLDEKEWRYFIFLPTVNTIGAIGILYIVITTAFSRLKGEIFTTWQLLPNIQIRPEPLENCIFLFISFPIYGTIIFKIEKNVKETDDSHHTE